MAPDTDVETPAESPAENAFPIDPTFRRNLEEKINAGFQVLGIESAEEQRCMTAIRQIGSDLSMPVLTWDAHRLWRDQNDDVPGKAKELENDHDPASALCRLGPDGPFDKMSAIIVFKDAEHYLGGTSGDDYVQRIVRSLHANTYLNSGDGMRVLIFLSTRLSLPDRLRPVVSMVEFPLPDEQQLDSSTVELIRRSVEKDLARQREDPDYTVEIDPELRRGILQDLRGLTATEAENALAAATLRHRGFSHGVRDFLKTEKAAIVKKSGILTYVDPQHLPPREDLGGFDNLLGFIDRRKLAYTPEAKEVGLDNPKGLVLLGVPGTAKSIAGKAIARIMDLPFYLLDVGSIFRSLIGESEAALREVIRLVTAQHGCVLMVDEVDKAFGNAVDSQGDSGVTRRVFGQFLTWLAEKDDQTFVVVTANRTNGLPPEFLRAGRFDAIFYTDLPDEDQRKTILEIHLRKRGVDPSFITEADWKQLLAAMKDFVGSEIEEVARESRFRSFEARGSGTPTLTELLEAAADVTPLSQFDQEGVQKIREFCRDRAKPVYLPKSGKKSSRKRRTMNLD